MNITPRPYQTDAVQSCKDLWQRHQTLIGRLPTGTGKTAVISMLVQDAVQAGGRALVLADTGVLVNQLAGAIEWATGIPVGVEQAGNTTLHWGKPTSRVVVGTVQTQWSGKDGLERMRSFDPGDFTHLFLDECEFFLAPMYRKVVDWYRSHPATRVLGVTATPMRSDGVSMAELFDAVAFDRDIRWGVHEGWLVPTRQAFIRVSVALGDCEKSKGDYRDSALAMRLDAEQPMVEMARGILDNSDGKTIVVAPRIETAKGITDYLNGLRPGCAKTLHGKLSDEKRKAVLDGHREGEYQFIVSVSLLTKGYDDDEVATVCMCRPTRSKRLYQQVWGRGTRPLKNVVDGIDEAEDRKESIASSRKPLMRMVNLVGIDEDVRDITTIDILAEGRDPKQIQQAKEAALAGVENVEEALREAEKREAMEFALAMEQSQYLERAEIAARTKVIQSVGQWYDPLAGRSLDPKFLQVKTNHLEVLAKAGVPYEDVKALADDPERTKKVVSRIVLGWKRGLASYKQCQLLKKFGIDATRMTKAQAKTRIDSLKKNGWRTP